MPPGVHAPEFTLTDQNGKPVSMAEYRGKPVVVTYLYSHCKETCPIQAQMIRGALDDLGHDVPALGVSVDPFRDTRRERARVPASKAASTGRMRFVLGKRRQLQPVWRGFAIQPQLADAEHQALHHARRPQGLPARGALPSIRHTPEDLAHDIRVLEREE